MIKVIKITPIEGKLMALVFSDGTRGTVDCTSILGSEGPMIAPLRDASFFSKVFLDNGAPTWPSGFDLARWAVHKDLKDRGLLIAAGADAAE